MHIELLWIIPILAFASFIFLIIFLVQKKNPRSDLTREVTLFNNGIQVNGSKYSDPDNRLEELERSISVVTQSISNQEKVIDRFKRENVEYNSEIKDLKDKLRELYKEYDIVLSENYSLRAKVKKMIEDKTVENKGGNTINNELPPLPKNIEKFERKGAAKVNLKLYEDTRLLNVDALNDLTDVNTEGRMQENR
jgi:chromosome segregation ATPase